MSIRTGTNKFVLGEKLTASDLNDTLDISVDALRATFGETISALKAVYLKASDGKVYNGDSDNLDEKIINFIGLSLEAGVNNDSKLVRMKGVVTGLSGLVAGVDYFIAKSGSSDADKTKTYGSSTGSLPVGHDGSTSDNRQGFQFTLTNPTKISKITLTLLKKTGSPTGNLVATIYKGTPSGSANDGGMTTTGFVATQSASALTTSFASYDLTFTDAYLQAGTYTILLSHDTLSSSNYMLLDRDSDTDATFWRYPSGGSWASGGGRTTYTITILAETYAVGDLTRYFFDFKKLVGKALSSTTLLLGQQQKSLNSPITKSVNTNYTAETDGFILVYETNTGATVNFQIYVDGVQLADWAVSSTTQNGSANVPVPKGSVYKVVSGGSPSIYWMPNV